MSITVLTFKKDISSYYATCFSSFIFFHLPVALYFLWLWPLRTLPLLAPAHSLVSFSPPVRGEVVYDSFRSCDWSLARCHRSSYCSTFSVSSASCLLASVLSFTSIFFFYDFSFLPSPTPSQLLFIPLSLSVFLSFFWLMRSVADVNLNQVLRSHKSCKARINSHVTARICFYCAFLSKVCTALWKLPTFLESNIGIVESLSL